MTPSADYEGTVPFDYGDGVDRPNWSPNADTEARYSPRGMISPSGKYHDEQPNCAEVGCVPYVREPSPTGSSGTP